MSNLFRKKSMDRISSPEQLNDYIRVSTPSVWLLLAAIVILLAGVCVWGVLGHMDTTLPVVIRAGDGQAIAYVRRADAEKVAPGMDVTIGDQEGKVAAIGAEPVVYPFRNECCGGYVTLEDKSLAQKKSNAVLESAESFGAEMVLTACPLCLYNLNKNATEHDLPVLYFTELLAEALGVKD